jgi:hypothetical protein
MAKRFARLLEWPVKLAHGFDWLINPLMVSRQAANHK